MGELEKKIHDSLDVDGKMPCKAALDIANSLKLEASAIGREMDRLKIKVKACQLGCFK